MPLRDIPVRLRNAASVGPWRSPTIAPAEPAEPATSTAARPHRACYAPSVHLYFQPDGDVRVCCLNLSFPLGNVADQRLPDIWNGSRRAELETFLARDEFVGDCAHCRFEIDTEGYEAAYPSTFDFHAAHLTDDPATWAWPTFMEFNLSNACNLQCIQCNGELSSSIRIHREGRAPLPKVYDDRFFDDLRPFLPHLTHVQVAGGEPFLGAENFRLWELIADEAPHIDCSVVTNATQWNDRVERVLERVPMRITLSIDGITRSTYEAIRVGADFDEVLTNIDLFADYARRAGTAIQINHCLMVQNHHEFGELLRFADAKGIRVETSVVRFPPSASIMRLDLPALVEVRDTLRGQADELEGALELNLAVWQAELTRIEAWVEHRQDRAEHDTSATFRARTILGFLRAGTHAHDDRDARAAMAAQSRDGVVHVVEVATGDVITACSPSLADAIGPVALDLPGQRVAALDEAAAARFGPQLDTVVLRSTTDQLDLLVTFGTTRFRSTLVALRDEQGWADQARILFAIDGSTDEEPVERAT